MIGSDADGSNVRFGSKADMCAAKRHVRFTPNSDRESEIPHRVMSALPPKADMCSATRHVRFGPEADMAAESRVRHRPNRSRETIANLSARMRVSPSLASDAHGWHGG
jgi:hypothetical protein